MKSDELDQAFSALRAEANGNEARSRATLARVLLTNRRASRRKLRLFKLWLPLAAVLVASTAWAAASGHLDGLLRSSPVLEPTHQSAMPARVEIDSSRAIQLVASSVTAAPEPSATLAPTASSASLPATASGPEAPSRLALDKAAYEVAYRAHSKTSAGDSAAGRAAADAAVAAWDQYISKFPRGRFLPEARYARAVALARAGRQGEAKQAMAPFAEGDGYRKVDAERWVESLEQKPAPTAKP